MVLDQASDVEQLFGTGCVSDPDVFLDGRSITVAQCTNRLQRVGRELVGEKYLLSGEVALGDAACSLK